MKINMVVKVETEEKDGLYLEVYIKFNIMLDIWFKD